MASFTTRLKHAWNVFTNKDPTPSYNRNGYYTRPDRVRLSGGNERSIVTAVLNRIALDASSIDIFHVRLDDSGAFSDIIKDSLHDCLTVEANIDQTARAFKQDAILSMFDEGCVALVPTVADIDPAKSGSYEVEELRTGKVVEWYSDSIKVRVYNEQKCRKEDVVVLKRTTAIVENPFYAVMNESNSTLQRLIRKLNLLDAIDEQSGSGKLDLIIQLPYVVRGDARRQQAEDRRRQIEEQLTGSKYGIAYTDGTEHITQLNRAVENNLMGQVEYLTSMLYSQLGITQGILDGTAEEAVMNNYYSRVIEPIMSAMVDEMKRKFLTKTARTQGQSIMYFRDPFKLVPTTSLAELADKFLRNEIMTGNEFRQIVGRKPSLDPTANELRNKNISTPADEQRVDLNGDVIPGTEVNVSEESNGEKEKIQNGKV